MRSTGSMSSRSSNAWFSWVAMSNLCGIRSAILILIYLVSCLGLNRLLRLCVAGLFSFLGTLVCPRLLGQLSYSFFSGPIIYPLGFTLLVLLLVRRGIIIIRNRNFLLSEGNRLLIGCEIPGIWATWIRVAHQIMCCVTILSSGNKVTCPELHIGLRWIL